ncbi:hypothetical protein E4U58_005462 [Claviceps cyperi]|nr:hypothetical protein E4U58_005462 [Claviceps cyperi]
MKKAGLEVWPIVEFGSQEHINVYERMRGFDYEVVRRNEKPMSNPFAYVDLSEWLPGGTHDVNHTIEGINNDIHAIEPGPQECYYDEFEYTDDELETYHRGLSEDGMMEYVMDVLHDRNNETNGETYDGN